MVKCFGSKHCIKFLFERELFNISSTNTNGLVLSESLACFLDHALRKINGSYFTVPKLLRHFFCSNTCSTTNLKYVFCLLWNLGNCFVLPVPQQTPKYITIVGF